MAKSRFKTKLSKKQKRKDIKVFLLVAVLSYVFTLVFSYSIGIFDDWSDPEIYILLLFMSFFVLSMLVFPTIIAASVLGFQKGISKRVRDDSTFVPVQNIDYYRDSLSDLNPSLVSLLIDLDIYGQKDIAAHLLRMQNKKVISFQKNGSITVTGENAQQLDQSEIKLLSIIKSNNLNNKKSFATWKQNHFYEAERLGYIKKVPSVKKEINGRAVLLGGLSLIAGICLWGVFLNRNLFETRSMIDFIIALVMLVMIDVLMFAPMYFLTRKASYYSRLDILWERTPLGNEMAEKIAGLGRFIKEFSRLSEAKKEEVMLWDDYLVYAIVLEENEQIVKDISKRYSFNLDRWS